MRYATAATPRGVQTTRAKSCLKSAKIRFPIPAKNTCQLVAPKLGAPDCHFLDSTDPNAQTKAPPFSASAYHNSLRPRAPVAFSPGHSKTTVPASPSPNPARPHPDILLCLISN